MFRFSAVACCAVALLFCLSGIEAQDEKGDLLRYKFEKGEKFTLEVSNKMSVKIEEMPEEFEGLLGEDAIEINFSMVVELTVEKVAKNGKATFKGKIKKMKVTGNMVIQELDFEYDADKDGKEEDPDEGGDEGGFNFDIEGALRDFARQPVELTVDKFGNVDLQSEAQGMGGGMAGQFLTLNGFMGALPKKRVKEGDTWKGKNGFKMQGLPMQLKINSVNTYVERKEVDGGAAAVIKSKYTVGTAGDDKGDDEGGGMPFQIDAKITGKGTGTTTFGIDANRVLTGSHKIKAKIDAKLENPMSGDEMTIKASLTLEQKLKLDKWVKDDY